MAEILEDGIKLTNEEGALLACALSASLCMLLHNIDLADYMLRAFNEMLTRHFTDTKELNKLQNKLGEMAARIGMGTKHFKASDVDERESFAQKYDASQN